MRKLADPMVALYVACHNPKLLLSVTSKSELVKLQADYSDLIKERIVYGDAGIW
jgi:hypothetical protein